MRGCVFAQDDAGKRDSFEQCLWLVGGHAPPLHDRLRIISAFKSPADLEGKIRSIDLNNSMAYLFFVVRADRLTMLNWTWKTLNCTFC